MAEVYFTATQAKKAARIVVPSVSRAGELKALLEAKGVQCSGTFTVGPNFTRGIKESRDALSFLNLIL